MKRRIIPSIPSNFWTIRNLLMVAFLFVSVIFNLLVLPLSVAASPAAIPVYEITTRGGLGKPIGIQGEGYESKYPLSNITQLFNSCLDEISIVVHGWALNETKAKERFDRVKMSLEQNQYIIPIVGFSWDSNSSWSDAKSIAQENGPKLAHFIFDYVDTCKHQHNKDVNVRLIAHSLGARVVLSTLDSLNRNQTWNNNNYAIKSVHFIGAAVDDEEISKDSADTGDSLLDDGQVYGEAIERQVTNFYNLFDPEDNMLEPRFTPPVYYPFFEGDLAVGYEGRQPGMSSTAVPSNYRDIDVESEIPNLNDADGDGNCDLPNPFIPNICTIAGIGDNHIGYLGFRDPVTDNLQDDGAINVVVGNWRSP
jgi:hypothetical protein